MKKVLLLVVLVLLPVLAQASVHCKYLTANPSTESEGGFYGFTAGDNVYAYFTTRDYHLYYWNGHVEDRPGIVGIGNVVRPHACVGTRYCKAEWDYPSFYDCDISGEVVAYFSQHVTNNEYVGLDGYCEPNCRLRETGQVYVEYSCGEAGTY